MPNVRALLFAAYRDRAGQAEVALSLASGSTVSTAIEQLRAMFPRLAGPGQQIVAAVNYEYAWPAQELRDGDEVALIPPVSGGAPPFVQVTDVPLDSAVLATLVHSPDHGAVVTFLGVTRNQTEGRRVLHLEYECYRPMAERQLEAIRTDLLRDLGKAEIAIAHRIGRLEIGEVSLVIAVGTPHSREAFVACSEILWRIKHVVPVWKREFFEDGAVWVGSEGGGTWAPPANFIKPM